MTNSSSSSSKGKFMITDILEADDPKPYTAPFFPAMAAAAMAMASNLRLYPSGFLPFSSSGTDSPPASVSEAEPKEDTCDSLSRDGEDVVGRYIYCLEKRSFFTT